MPVEQPSDIYREQLTSLYHGLALWDPNPVENVFTQVSIGDVGYISSEGIFIRMFNVTLPWDDPSNRRLAQPEPYGHLTPASIIRGNFSQVDYYSRNVSREENFGNIHAATHQQWVLVILSQTLRSTYDIFSQNRRCHLYMPGSRRASVSPLRRFS